MKNCQQIQDRMLTDFMDGRSSATDRSAIENHLLSCADCRAVLASARDTESLLHAAPDLAPPDHCWTAIRQSLDASAEPAGFNPWNSWLDTLFGSRQRGLSMALATLIILVVATIPAILNTQRQQASAGTGSMLIALIDERDQVTAIDDRDLDTAAEYFLTYKEGSI